MVPHNSTIRISMLESTINSAEGIHLDGATERACTRGSLPLQPGRESFTQTGRPLLQGTGIHSRSGSPDRWLTLARIGAPLESYKMVPTELSIPPTQGLTTVPNVVWRNHSRTQLCRTTVYRFCARGIQYVLLRSPLVQAAAESLSYPCSSLNGKLIAYAYVKAYVSSTFD